MYLMLKPAEEQQIIARLKGLEFGGLDGAEVGARKIIATVCHCTDEEAEQRLRDLRDRGRIEVEITQPGVQLGPKEPMPEAKFTWVVPSTND